LVRPSLVGVLLLGGFAAGSAQPYRVDTLGRAPTVQYPVSVAFVPGGAGKFFFTEKNSGRVRVYDRGIQTDPFLTLLVEDEGEQGLRGLAFHPAYPDTPFVFVFYTRKIDRSNVVERYTDSGGVGVDPRLVLVVPRRDDGTINNGGALAFGPDGTLFIGVGDYGTPAQAQDVVARRNYWGKILRVNIDGSFPADNPFPRNPIWAYGVRDPQGIAFDPLTGDMVCTDGGTQGKNAVHLVTREANLGWPLRGIGRKPLVAFGLSRGSVPPAARQVADRGEPRAGPLDGYIPPCGRFSRPGTAVRVQYRLRGRPGQPDRIDRPVQRPLSREQIVAPLARGPGVQLVASSTRHRG
jgi:glucose/arabinose dehydrogenase